MQLKFNFGIDSQNKIDNDYQKLSIEEANKILFKYLNKIYCSFNNDVVFLGKDKNNYYWTYNITLLERIEKSLRRELEIKEDVNKSLKDLINVFFIDKEAKELTDLLITIKFFEVI